MRAYVYKYHDGIKQKKINAPGCTMGSVMVSVGAAGISEYDIEQIYGENRSVMTVIPGHEVSGTVVGPVNTEWNGKRVAVYPIFPCKKCTSCLKGRYETCDSPRRLGTEKEGAFADLVVVPEWNLIEISDKVSFKAAAIFEPLASAVHAIRFSGLKLPASEEDSGKKIVIHGLDLKGLMALMLLLDGGYSDIYAIGKKTYQKEKAIELGLDEEKMIDFTDKDKFPGEADVYFECSGTSETLNYAACGLKAGGSIVLVNEADAQLNLFEDSYDRILKKELTIKGSFSSHFDHSEDDDWHYIIRRIEQGLDVEPLITHEFDFNDMIKGLELMRDKSEDYIKVIGKY